MLFSLVRWWYGAGWLEAVRDIVNRPAKVGRDFSIGIMVRTMFSPWRRIISAPGRSIEAKFRAMLDNLISRMVGFVVRLLALIAAGLLALMALLICLVIAVVWPFVPVLILYFCYQGITG